MCVCAIFKYQVLYESSMPEDNFVKVTPKTHVHDSGFGGHHDTPSNRLLNPSDDLTVSQPTHANLGIVSRGSPNSDELATFLLTFLLLLACVKN